jgi:uncharacterized membrane protein YdbT with pleckstrin-like domain
MAYYKKVLRPGENVVFLGRIHWKVYLRPVSVAVLAMFVATIASSLGMPSGGAAALSSAFWLIALYSFLAAWWLRWTTEIVVTNKRVLLKLNWIAIKTREINLTKIETVDIRQSIADRLLNAGSVIIVGIGGSWEPFGPIAEPLRFRNAIAVG